MKPLTRAKEVICLLIILAAVCFVSNDDYHTLYVEQYIAQGMEDELAKPRLELVEMQADADRLLALQEIER